MSSQAADLSRRLARQAEAVCRYYLPKGRRCGLYWIAGDVRGAPGRSLYVRLKGPDHGPGAAGKWTDAATGEHGDLLDLIALNRGLDDLADACREAATHLVVPVPGSRPEPMLRWDRAEAARRIFRTCRPLAGTHGEAYLRARGISCTLGEPALRFHPGLRYRAAEGHDSHWPALVAAVTDGGGTVVGIQRTWLDPGACRKAPLADPRRALGDLLGNGVRFGSPGPVMLAGEGIETVLSLRSAMPSMPMIAALSAAHLAALQFPAGLVRLYVARDRDRAGTRAAARLRDRARAAAVDLHVLVPRRDDFNADLLQGGPTALRITLGRQLLPADTGSFLAGDGDETA